MIIYVVVVILVFSLGVTGGLAAPLVAAGAGAVIGASSAAVLGTTAGVAVIASLFGAAGAGLTGMMCIDPVISTHFHSLPSALLPPSLSSFIPFFLLFTLLASCLSPI